MSEKKLEKVWPHDQTIGSSILIFHFRNVAHFCLLGGMGVLWVFSRRQSRRRFYHVRLYCLERNSPTLLHEVTLFQVALLPLSNTVIVLQLTKTSQLVDVTLVSTNWGTNALQKRLGEKPLLIEIWSVPIFFSVLAQVREVECTKHTSNQYLTCYHNKL